MRASWECQTMRAALSQGEWVKGRQIQPVPSPSGPDTRIENTKSETSVRRQQSPLPRGGGRGELQIVSSSWKKSYRTRQDNRTRSPHEQSYTGVACSCVPVLSAGTLFGGRTGQSPPKIEQSEVLEGHVGAMNEAPDVSKTSAAITFYPAIRHTSCFLRLLAPSLRAVVCPALNFYLVPCEMRESRQRENNTEKWAKTARKNGVPHRTFPEKRKEPLRDPITRKIDANCARIATFCAAMASSTDNERPVLNNWQSVGPALQQ